MGASVWLTLAGSGLVVGFVSGLVGIGGGVLTVPLLYFIYAHPEWSGATVAPALQAAVAHATSLLVIVPTALAGTWTYQRRGAVAWRAALPIAGSSILAALVATRLAPLLPEAALKLSFGVLLLVSGWRLVGHREEGWRVASGPPRPGLAVVGGVAVGALSALLGVGGGIVAIPILVYLVRLDLPRVAATSMAIILFTAAAGVAGYASAAPGPAGLPAGTVGYVHWAAALPIVAGSVLAVRSGAVVNQRLGTRTLAVVFGLLFAALGSGLVLRGAGSLGALF